MTDWETAKEWKKARKLPVEVEVMGPFTESATIKTLEGQFDIDEEYLEEHGSFYIIRGVEGEMYPIAKEIFKETYEFVGENQDG